MAEVLLFHHIRGLTPGVVAFADELRASGHTVHTPDLFGGRIFASIDEGMAFTRADDAPAFDDLADSAAAELPSALVHAGFSWGVMQAQRLAQTRSGARGALLFESCAPVSGEYSFGPWPEGLRVQIHGMEGDEFFREDLPAARELVEAAGSGVAQLLLYPGNQHLFADRSLPSYDAEAAATLTRRCRAFLDEVG